MIAPETRGILVVVVGASGAGKDSVLVATRRMLASEDHIRFAIRTVTRPVSATSPLERSGEPAAFTRDEQRGAFALTWRAHGLAYGIPRHIDDWLAQGSRVVINGARSALARIDARYPERRLIEIRADPAIIATRLRQRGRDTSAAIAARERRNAALASVHRVDAIIDTTTTPLEVNAARLAALLRRWHTPPACTS